MITTRFYMENRFIGSTFLHLAGELISYTLRLVKLTTRLYKSILTCHCIAKKQAFRLTGMLIMLCISALYQAVDKLLAFDEQCLAALSELLPVAAFSLIVLDSIMTSWGQLNVITKK